MNENILPYTPLISYFRDNEGRLELDFESDPTDIIYSEHGLLDRSSMVRPTRDAEDTEQIQSLKVRFITQLTEVTFRYNHSTLEELS